MPKNSRARRQILLLDRHLTAIIAPSVAEKIPPQMELCVATAEKMILQKKFGPHSQYYDVASLTKALVTVPLMMKLFEERRVKLAAPVKTYLPWLEATAAGQITILNLLSHHSGLTWWQPFYKELNKMPLAQRTYFFKHKFRSEKVKPLTKCVYSDLGFILLGWVIEEILELPLDEAASRYIFEPLSLHDTFFARQEARGLRARSKFAPTLDLKPRGRIQGEVFDDNAASVGGVSGHAGLFSTLNDVTRLAQEFLRAYQKRPGTLWSSKVLKLFATRAVPEDIGDWALGFNLPTMPTTNAGGLISPRAFGHWAFTGPSFWIDPDKKALVVILANRTFPNYNEPKRYQKFLALRRLTHDSIWEVLK